MRRLKFKILLLLVVGCFAFESHACRMQNNGSNNHLVVTIEGLGGRLLGSQAQRTANALNRGNYTVLSCAQDTDSEASIARKIIEFKRANPNARITVMGHSLGGGDSVRILNSAGVTVDDLIVWDGRDGHELTCGSGNGPKYTKPANVKRVTNFYQCGFMPGRRFKEGQCVRNVNMNAGPMAHTQLPNTSKNYVNGILNGERPTSSEGCSSTVAQNDVTEEATPQRRLLVRRPVTSVFNRRSRNVRRRVQVNNKWADHPKANQKALCEGPGGRHYECTYAEASALNYSESNR